MYANWEKGEAMLRVRIFVGNDYMFWYWCEFIPRAGDYIERNCRDGKGNVVKERYRVERCSHIVEEQIKVQHERADVAHLHCVQLPLDEAEGVA
jgi:hypothetical protein